MRARHTLTLHRVSDEGGYDEFGNPIQSVADAEPIKAYSIGPRFSTEADRVLSIGLTAGLPESYGIKAGDSVTFEGETFEVDGDLVSANHGHGRYRPGYIMYLRRGSGE